MSTPYNVLCILWGHDRARVSAYVYAYAYGMGRISRMTDHTNLVQSIQRPQKRPSMRFYRCFPVDIPPELLKSILGPFLWVFDVVCLQTLRLWLPAYVYAHCVYMRAKTIHNCVVYTFISINYICIIFVFLASSCRNL